MSRSAVGALRRTVRRNQPNKPVLRRANGTTHGRGGEPVELERLALVPVMGGEGAVGVDVQAQEDDPDVRPGHLEGVVRELDDLALVVGDELAELDRWSGACNPADVDVPENGDERAGA
ncbi:MULTISPECIES: hypothetical protein [Streptomyces]|uniref:Uncharacterized protein n=1 Tax=Streptomyces gibsoniae TaxID=3075529 RepID=A0ABU2U8Y3_9ACTN|nr:hypothetical protein [Streptomyces sp. DSM 41699]MDT0469699.1 hypothetical protein [Streptomyces sp. DSM 41699]